MSLKKLLVSSLGAGIVFLLIALVKRGLDKVDTMGYK